MDVMDVFTLKCFKCPFAGTFAAMKAHCEQNHLYEVTTEPMMHILNEAQRTNRRSLTNLVPSLNLIPFPPPVIRTVRPVPLYHTVPTTDPVELPPNLPPPPEPTRLAPVQSVFPLIRTVADRHPDVPSTSNDVVARPDIASTSADVVSGTRPRGKGKRKRHPPTEDFEDDTGPLDVEN
jgi:hypothetical protein